MPEDSTSRPRRRSLYALPTFSPRRNKFADAGVYWCMFEQSILANTSKSKPWTLAISLLGQTSLVLLAALIPLIYTDQLPGLSKWAENLVAPLPPAAQVTPPEQQTRARPASDPKVFRVPGNIPPNVIKLVDDMTQFVPQTFSDTISGSIPGPAVPNALSQMFTNMTVPKPPPPTAPVKAKAADSAPIRAIRTIQEAKLLTKNRSLSTRRLRSRPTSKALST